MKKIKALNSEQERNIEPHQRSSLVTDNWHDRKNSSLVSTDRFINITCRKDDGRNNLKTLETTLTERKDYSHVVISSIESQENNNRKDDVIEMIQKNPSSIIQKNKLDVGKDIEKVRDFEREMANNPKETLRKEFSIERDIEKDKERNKIRKEKEKENDGLVKVVNKENDSLEKVVNKEDSSKKSNNSK